MVQELRELVNKVYDVENLKRKEELRALQSLINPHFLYNTLDTIQWKAIVHNAYDVADMIHELSELFRISLSDGRELILIYQEMSMLNIINKYKYNTQLSHLKTVILL